MSVSCSRQGCARFFRSFDPPTRYRPDPRAGFRLAPSRTCELGHYTKGLELARQLVATHPSYFTGYIYVAMNAVALDEIDEARAAIVEGRRVQPDLSIALMQGYLGIHRPEVDNRRNEALRAAGLD